MDWCTFWPEGWWARCCQAHDEAYADQIGQALADADLMRCVAESAPSGALSAASVLIAGAMFIGVRLFGRRFYRKAAESPQ